MMKFARIFPNVQIVASLVQQLSWTHFLHVISIKDEIKRVFCPTVQLGTGPNCVSILAKDLKKIVMIPAVALLEIHLANCIILPSKAIMDILDAQKNQNNVSYHQ